MPRIRRVLKHVSVETAARKRKCYRKPDDHSIAKGRLCLVVKDESSGGSSNYCPECAEPILDAAQDDLSLLRTQLRL
jgi:hypothetical protein